MLRNDDFVLEHWPRTIRMPRLSRWFQRATDEELWVHLVAGQPSRLAVIQASTPRERFQIAWLLGFQDPDVYQPVSTTEFRRLLDTWRPYLGASFALEGAKLNRVYEIERTVR